MEQDYNGYFGRPAPANSTQSASATPNNRPSTPNTEVSGRTPLENNNDNISSHRVSTINPFQTPGASRPPSSYTSSGPTRLEDLGQKYFHSRLVQKGEVERPWMDKKDPKEKWVTIFPLVGILIGLALSGFLIYDGLGTVAHHKYCPLLEENFDGGLNTNIWQKEVQVGGYGNGQFDYTTGGDENVFIQNGNLVIKATLQDEAKMTQNTTINLIKDGTCTSDKKSDCIVMTNTYTGNDSVVNPAKSGRINTRKGATLKYGRVEVTAKLPQGDWLWPAIWMMPVKDTYGPWPASGEIDIMESRGNNWTYEQGGSNIMSSALHWGPDPANDAWWKTNNKRTILRGSYADDFNTFGLEWSQKYIFTYVNTRLLQVLYTNFDKPMWDRGAFSDSTANGTRVTNSWSQTGRDNTPFDQEFYLIINLAVGGTNGWFEDGKSGKPWLDHSTSAKKDFWNSRDRWFPTWKQPQLEVKKVVMMKQCDGNEDL